MPAHESPKQFSEPSLTTPQGVRAWLESAVAEAAGLDPPAVDPNRPLAELGLSSRQLVTLAADLSASTGRPLDPSLIFNHPTIAALAQAVFDETPTRTTPAAVPPSNGTPARADDDIAIISMACRLPGGADHPEALWRLLAAGEDAITEAPAGRWDTRGLHDPDPDATGKAYSLRGGYLVGIDRFDASFFGISPREAAAMDPQQRLLLQTSWEAVERAGIVPDTLNGSSTGVYVGLYDSGYLASAALDQLDGHVGTGSASSVASGRIAYTLGLQGPAVTVDTACSSSLVALHLAARALAGGECDLALAGGATLLVTPRGHVEFSRLRGLSPSGRCSPFSADADGVVWAEGCGVVLLKRLTDARRDGDRILAVVKGSAINQDGRSQGLSAPNGPAQERVLRAALDAAGLQPHDLDHIEAHGTGTPLGDPIEAGALASVFGPGRPADHPLGVGSLKSNIGHTQAAAGIAGVIKTVLALHHERMPASLHTGTPTGHIDWPHSGLRLIGEPRTWPRNPERVRRAGVSAFGISGTNAHVVLEEAPAEQTGQAPADLPGAGLFPLAARTRPALRAQAGRLLETLEHQPELPLPAVAATLAHHRTHFEHRAVVRASDREELLTALRALTDGRPAPELTAGPSSALTAGKLAFVFPGQGAQWGGMARDLLDRDPVFADELDRCDAALRPFTGWSVPSVLRGDEGAPALDRVDVVQPVLFAVMVSLAAVWRARGVRPDAVVGHSQGEVAAACVAGALSLNDAAAVVALRSQALTELSGTGTMAVVALPHTEVEARLAAHGCEIAVAAVNSGRSTVIAGAADAVQALLTDLERQQIFVRRLDVDYASHSDRVEPVRTTILEELDGVTTCPTSVAWYSTVTAEPVTDELEADYWYTNLREPVRFASTVERMAADGYRYFVELSPHPSLLTALHTIDERLVAVGSLRRDEDGPACLDRATAELHVHGRRIDWHRPVPRTTPADLPTYAWDAQRHWIEPAACAGPPGLFDRAAHPLLGIQLQSADRTRWTFRDEWSPATADWLPDHTVFGRTVVSGTTLLELCRAALAVARPDTPADVCDLLLLAPLTLPGTGTVEVSVEVVTAGAVPEITIHSRPRGQEPTDWILHATASAAEPAAAPAGEPPTWPETAEPAWAEDTYARLTELGLGYGPAFQGVRQAAATGDGTLLARLALPPVARDAADPYPVHPALLDAALHVAAALESSGRRVMLPVAMARCVLPPGGATDLTVSVRRTGGAGTDPTPDHTPDLTLDVTLWDADGFPAGRLEGVRLRAVNPADLNDGSENGRHLYEVAWTAVPERQAEAPGTVWAVRGDRSDPAVATALRDLRTAGVQVTDEGADTVVRVWPRTTPDAQLAGAAHEVAAKALAELQALIALPPDEAPARTIWVTRGAISATDGDRVPDVARSVLWGLARSARAEHPDLGLTLLDLDGDEAPLLCAAAHADEPELALRTDELLAPRLVRARPAPPGRPAPIPTDGTVLITGGLGAVGRGIARLLAENGVPRLLLTSRQGAGDPGAADVVAELAALGADVEIAACDVADAAAVAGLLGRIGDESPLRGVVHCAGVLADGVVAELTSDRLAQVLRPKVDGAAHLHRLTAEAPLDLFLLVSSAAGVVGNAGQANYAAANVLLDQLAYHRRALGLPAVSVSFGAWAGGGLAAEHADLERMARLGHRALTPGQGRELTELALRREAPHLVAWALDLPRLKAAAPTGALWRSLLPAPHRAGSDSPTPADRLARLPEPERAARVLALVREEAAHALGLRSADSVRPDQPLRDLGMDSVTAVDLRNRISARIGAKLPATLLFDHPTPTRLTEYLLTGALATTRATSREVASVSASVSASTPSSDEPVALVAMACRLPGGVVDPEGLWHLVAEGRDAVGPFPAGRWDVESLYDPDPDALGKSYAREGGFLDDIESFDAGFFGITPKEAAAMDPQQRLLLETAWESLERAGIVPADLAGSTTGVYVGMFGSDYLSGTRLDQLDGYVGTGSALSVASGRLAYTLGLNGPALTVDTACSSSLVAVHLAAQALRAGECDLALAGGVTLMVTPQTFVEFSRLRGLSPTGRCRSFSDGADGAIWAEGAGMVVLKRLSDARRGGDRVLAVLRGTAVNQDGRSQGLSAPNGPAQERVIRRALEQSGLRPADIDHIEAHGTGTTLGDPIEANALAEVFGDSRPEGRPLYLGSLKSNVGHAQAASGVLGLIKVVQSLHNESLPRTLHADTPSRHVDWADSGLHLLREATAWPASRERIRRAGVSAFGISGTNAHVIVEEAGSRAESESAGLPTGTPLFLLSGRSEAGLRGQAGALARHLADDSAALPDVAHALAHHRSHFEWRTAVVAGDPDELRSVLGEFAAGRIPLPPPREEQTGKVAFVYAGHGGQWPGMGLDLLAESEAFREELTRIDEAVRRHAGWSVLNALRAPEEFSPLERTEYLQPTLFAVNAALTAAWRSLGVTPDGVTGHSLGEIAAAYSAGALTLDDAVAVVTGRAQAVVPVAGKGGMLSLDLPRPRVEELLAPYAGRLFLAAVNSPHSTAVSGDGDALAELRRSLDEQGIRARSLSTPFASHTPLMAPLRDALLDSLSGIRPAGHPTTPLYSTVLAEPVPGERLDPAYWYANLSEPVRFADTITRMLADGYRYFVELSPHPSLGSSVEAVAAQAGIDAVSVGSLGRQRGGRDVLLRRLGELYTAGHTPDWPTLFPAGRRVDLPTYAFARERHWLAPAPATATGASPLLDTHVEASDEAGRHLFQGEVDLRDSRFAYLTDHRVTGEVWLPGAAFLDMALEAAAAVRESGDVRLCDVRFLQPLRLDASRPTRLQLVLRPAADGFRHFTIASAPGGGGQRASWERHVDGRIAVAPAEPAADPGEPLAALRERCTEPADLPAVYAALAALGIEYGPAFRGLESGHRTHSTALARLADRPAAGHLLHPAVLDAAFHTAALPGDAPQGRAFVPAGVGRLRHTGVRTTPVWVTCELRSVSGDTATVDLRLYDERDRLILEADEFELAALSPLDGALFETRWQSRPLADEPPAPGRWLILADESGTARELVERLGTSVPHVIARRGAEFTAEDPGHYVLDPSDPRHLARLLDEAFANEPPERVVQLSALDAPAVENARTAEEAARLCCLSTLHLVRAIAERAQAPAPRLFVVVRGSQAAGDSAQVTHPQQALAWGFGLAVAQEHPELRTTLVDLPPTDGADALWTQLRHADDERLVALRGAGRLVPRLARTRSDDAGHGATTPDGVYLITGGLGGLGRVVAERLVRRGARRLALMSRSAPTADALGWIHGLEERGVSVHLAHADVADRTGLTAALDAVRHALGPITGVVHAAGVLDDATIGNLTDERVLRVLAPKVLGTALLTELTPDAQDFVLFASAAGLLGSAGQSPYSAANAFLDAWAHHLSHADRRALSLDWGAWSGVGMVAESGVREAQTGRSGLVAFSAQDGGELLERVLGTARRQLAPMALDWELLALDADAARGRPILADMVTVTTGAPGTDDLVEKVFAATTGTERVMRLEAYVRARVGEVSGGAVQVSATTALKELGLDSLMLVRLRNAFARELGVELPAATVFSAADIRGLAQALSTALPARDTTAPDEPQHVAEVPATELHPVTRDVVRLLRSARPGMPDAAHAVGLAVRLTTPTTRETLTGILTRLTARHAALRTAVVTATEGGRRLRVERELPEPPLRWTVVPDDTAFAAADRLRELLEAPFDLAAAPLWRFELLDRGERGQILVYGAHHAVSDLQSLLLVAAEIDAELTGGALGDTVTNRDIRLLIEAQSTDEHTAGSTDTGDWHKAFEGSARLDLTLSRPRPETRSYRAGSVTVPIPDGLMDRIATAASRLAVTPAAFCLGTLTVLLARKRERERFVIAVPVDTRIHADAYDAVGFFGVPVPFPAEARAGERIEEVLRRTDGRLQRVLTKGAMFSDVLPVLAGQGLHRADAPLVEVYFNYVRAAGGLSALEVLPAGTGYSDLDLMITLTPDAGRIRLDHNLDILDAETVAALGEELLRLLAETAAGPPLPAPSGTLALAATFALGNLPLMCATVITEAVGDGSVTTVAEAPYHHVLASLRDPSGVFADPATTAGVVLLRAADLQRFGPVDDALLAELRNAYPAALRAVAERTRKPLIVGFLPSARGEDRLVRWERETAAELAEAPGIAVLGPDDWTRHHPVGERFDERTERLAHLPFTAPFQAAVALRLAEVVRAVRRPAPKVIAVDGDETLWGGVAGEIGPDAVDLSGPRALLARRLLRWRAAGALLVLVSNNDEDTVRAVLDRPDSPLKAEHFSVLSAAWGPKPARLADAARTLGLGLDSFLFLDDNPAEIAKTRAALPQVLSVTCPPVAELPQFLGRLWPLVPAAATAEDGLRARFYEQERARDTAREQAGFEEFLEQLELLVDVRALSDDDVPRAEQLVRRTNQFTLRARSADGGDVARWREHGEIWTATARDRFGDYGQIGLLALRREGDRLDVLNWLMSCRALGRGVEERLLRWLAERAEELGCAKVRLTAERTARNTPARRLLSALGGGDQDDDRLETVVTPEQLRKFRSWRQQ
ncbi:SDR family NAD(P)-dependent oxidoreductase [Streptomyces sp. NPDC057623]|uniref:SDR family NAD(P)-dependent oxidoreductase n=1 Tax=Streptomyces sp. NPDC057623 TaxID=3346187 RepID=UPI0036C9416F